MIYTISRPPTDTFSYSLFRNLLNTLNCEYDAYYIWSSPPDTLTKFFRNIDFNNKPNVIIGIKDLLDMWLDYNYWKDTAQAGTQLIDAVASAHPNTNFVILTSLENLHLEEIKSPNVQIVPWGGDCVNQHSNYQTLAPVINKDFASTKHVISLNRNIRDHRIVYLSYLLGRNLDVNASVSCLGIYNLHEEFEPTDFLGRIFWRFDEHHNDVRNILLEGYKRFFVNQRLIIDEYDIYGEQQNNNIMNFNNNLRYRYQNSFVEIVTESSFCSPAYMLTEKTMHAFYGCNFPIILAGSGAVAHLRGVGFDMFDDIIDHSYDLQNNPIDRITQAIDLNERLLLDGDYVKECWKQNKDRFLKNVEVANNITNCYAQRATELWKQVKWK